MKAGIRCIASDTRTSWKPVIAADSSACSHEPSRTRLTLGLSTENDHYGLRSPAAKVENRDRYEASTPSETVLASLDPPNNAAVMKECRERCTTRTLAGSVLE
jgi:hypothetical protein